MEYQSECQECTKGKHHRTDPDRQWNSELDGSLIAVGNPVSRANLVDTRYHCPAALEYSSHFVTISAQGHRRL